MNEKIDFSAYSNDELDQFINDIQNIKINRKDTLLTTTPPIH